MLLSRERHERQTELERVSIVMVIIQNVWTSLLSKVQKMLVVASLMDGLRQLPQFTSLGKH